MYEAFASEIRRMSYYKCSSIAANTLSTNAATTMQSTENTKRFKTSRNRKSITILQATEGKLKSKCETRNKYVHWSSDHKNDGKIRLNLPTAPSRIIVTNMNNDITEMYFNKTSLLFQIITTPC